MLDYARHRVASNAADRGTARSFASVIGKLVLQVDLISEVMRLRHEAEGVAA